MKENYNFNVYFEIYGKKMRIKVLAKDAKEAEEIVKAKLHIVKTEKAPGDEFNECMDMLNTMSDFLKNKS